MLLDRLRASDERVFEMLVARYDGGLRASRIVKLPLTWHTGYGPQRIACAEIFRSHL